MSSSQWAGSIRVVFSKHDLYEIKLNKNLVDIAVHMLKNTGTLKGQSCERG
jgi:hypothetical protein